MEIQQALGLDIVMAFDECPPYPADREAQAERVDGARRCAGRERCDAAHAAAEPPGAVRHRAGRHAPRTLRARVAERSRRSASTGYAIGGLAVGEPEADARACSTDSAPAAARRTGRAT